MTQGSYTVELSKALYEQQRGNPSSYLLQELGAHMLFSHIGRQVGVVRVTQGPIPRVGGAQGRCQLHNPITVAGPDEIPQVVILSELSFVMPRGGRPRGVLPVVSIYDRSGELASRFTRRAVQMTDRAMWGPFVPPEYDEPFRTVAEDFMDILADPQTGRIRHSLDAWEAEQTDYTNLLRGIAESLDIGQPPKEISSMTEFIVPRSPSAFGRTP